MRRGGGSWYFQHIYLFPGIFSTTFRQVPLVSFAYFHIAGRLRWLLFHNNLSAVSHIMKIWVLFGRRSKITWTSTKIVEVHDLWHLLIRRSHIYEMRQRSSVRTSAKKIRQEIRNVSAIVLSMENNIERKLYPRKVCVNNQNVFRSGACYF